MLQPNTERHNIRQELVEIRRQIYRVRHVQADREMLTLLRRAERRLSRELSATPAFLDHEGEPTLVVPNNHFQRFRHSSRFRTFIKVWSRVHQRSFWQRKVRQWTKRTSSGVK